MFYYFGRKGRLAPYYPAPVYDTVIEPFAGSMAYTLHHRPQWATGIEIDEAVVRSWEWITNLAPSTIAEIYEPAVGERVNHRWKMMAAGSHGTSRAESYLWTERMARDLAKQKRLAARHSTYASRHVQYRLGDYRDAPDVEATWFIDPPYQHVRRGYERDAIDYAELADWCLSRRGQLIVCEQAGADWLPFTPLRGIRGTTNKVTLEVTYLSREMAA